MTTNKKIMTVLASALLVGIAPAVSAGGGELPFGEAELFFELNDTDGDLGLHALIDGDPWKLLEIEGPSENTLLSVLPEGSLGRHGMTELAFESAEPPFDELPPAAFFRRFPAGLYEVSGITVEGKELESTVKLSHVMPAPVDNIRVSGKAAAEDCDAALPRVGKPVIIDWDPVKTSHPDIGKPGVVHIQKYQVFVELETFPYSKFSLELPPHITRFAVPKELLRLGRDLEFEIIARATNHNQTAIESCFILLN